MATVNISLPSSLGQKLDEIIRQEGYASRSEFVRTLIRFYVFSQEKDFVLSPFKKLPTKRVEKELKATGIYNDAFIKSVITGLRKSSVYAKS